MSDDAVPGTVSVPEIQARLDGVARLLRESPTIDPEQREELADLVEELRGVLQSGAVAPAEAAVLADTAAHLAEALRHHRDKRRLTGILDRIEQKVLAAEAEAPVASGLVMRLIDALANLGI